jgi:hypothetical protein
VIDFCDEVDGGWFEGVIGWEGEVKGECAGLSGERLGVSELTGAK